MGKGSKPRPVSKNYGNEYDRIFGKRCTKHHRVDCAKCSPKPESPPEENWVDAFGGSDY